jgi:catabolite repression HPr-like protein
MIKKAVTVRAKMDMEAHPIAHLVQEASQYRSQVFIEIDNKKINAKSIMGMMTLQLMEGVNLTVVADGADEVNAVNGLETFLTTAR